MSDSLRNSATLASDLAFRGQVRAAMIEKAIGIISNGATNQLHRTLALRVMSDPEPLLGIMVNAVANAGPISQVADPATVPDSSVRTVVDAAWPRVAEAWFLR